MDFGWTRPWGSFGAGGGTPAEDAGPAFTGQDASASTLVGVFEALAAYADTSGPAVGGSLTVNGVGFQDFDVAIVDGNTTLTSSSDMADYFTATEDTRAAFIIIKGDLTVDAGAVVIPLVRKLMTGVYVTGALTLNGDISMSARGANHAGDGDSGFGSPYDPTGALIIATGTYDKTGGGTVIDPEVPAVGGAAGAPESAGGDGTTGATAGGGGGGRSAGYIGAAGSMFSGGPGGGGKRSPSAGETPGTPGQARGGAGGNGDDLDTSSGAAGAGNPSGTSGTGADAPTADGTGGTLIVVAVGPLTGSGNLLAAGVAGAGGASTPGGGGGGSGGGSVTAIVGTDSSIVTVAATGGAGGSGTSGAGGAGGDGDARILSYAPAGLFTDSTLFTDGEGWII